MTTPKIMQHNEIKDLLSNAWGDSKIHKNKWSVQLSPSIKLVEGAGSGPVSSLQNLAKAEASR